MTPSTSRASLWADVRTGWLYAGGFSILAVLIIGWAVLRNAVGASHVKGLDQVLPFGLPLVILGYFAAGTLGGCAFWVLRLLGESLIGWICRGFMIATLVYGIVGVTGIIGFYFGANLLDLESASEGWHLIPPVSLLAGGFSGTLVGVYYWYQRRHGDRSAA